LPTVSQSGKETEIFAKALQQITACRNTAFCNWRLQRNKPKLAVSHSTRLVKTDASLKTTPVSSLALHSYKKNKIVL